MDIQAEIIAIHVVVNGKHLVDDGAVRSEVKIAVSGGVSEST